MPNQLLSAADTLEALAALRDVTYTFHKNNITYHQISTDYDQWKENNSKTTTDIVLKCRIAIKDDKNVTDEGGTENPTNIEATFDFSYLAEQTPTLVSGNEAVFINEKEEMTFNGSKYKIKNISNGDTEFQGLPVLIVVTLQLIRKKV